MLLAGRLTYFRRYHDQPVNEASDSGDGRHALQLLQHQHDASGNVGAEGWKTCGKTMDCSRCNDKTGMAALIEKRLTPRKEGQ